MPRLVHFDDNHSVRFVTFSCYRKTPYLLDNHACELFVEALNEFRTRLHISILGYVLMPDHVHLVLYPAPDTELGPLIGKLKGTVSHSCRSVPVPMWNKRCYDHNCRSISSVKEKIVYCHNNPVRRELVESASDWKWSSAAWYEGKRDVPLAMDEYEL